MISVHADTKRVTRSLSRFAMQQVPFATAQALTALAKRVQADEKENMRAKFKTPTPFTVNSVGVRGATKRNQTARVFVKPIAARYLKPFETGGSHVLNSSALLNPKDIRLNKYGNLPRRKLAQLRSKKNVFIGTVNTKAGPVDGVWQRMPARRGKPAHLKLLIRFGNALPVDINLGYQTRARRIVSRHFDAEFGAALGRAIATAR